MRHCPYTSVQTRLQADHPNLSLCFYHIWRQLPKCAATFWMGGSTHSFSSFHPIHYPPPLWWTGCFCDTPSFQFAQKPLHLSTFILSFPLSHSFSHFLCLPSSNTCCESHDWQLVKKKEKGERWKEAVLQMDIHPVPMQSLATPSWCFKTHLSWGRQVGNRFKARRKERDKWRKNKKFRFKLAEQPKGSSRTKN